MLALRTYRLTLAANVSQISEGTNSVGIVRWDLGFCLCAVITSASQPVRFINEKYSKKMIQKNKLHMLGLLGAMVIMGNEMPNGEREYVKPKETDEQRKRRISKAERERYKAQGLTEFFYGENSLWALNQKSADRKARQRHWL